MNGGGVNVFGIGSVISASIGDVSTSDWTFTMSYNNAQQAKMSHVTYKLDASGGTRFAFISESPANTYVSCCLSYSLPNMHMSCSKTARTYGQACSVYFIFVLYRNSGNFRC